LLLLSSALAGCGAICGRLDGDVGNGASFRGRPFAGVRTDVAQFDDVTEPGLYPVFGVLVALDLGPSALADLLLLVPDLVADRHERKASAVGASAPSR
jgi:hypothetical protein